MQIVHAVPNIPANGERREEEEDEHSICSFSVAIEAGSARRTCRFELVFHLFLLRLLVGDKFFAVGSKFLLHRVAAQAGAPSIQTQSRPEEGEGITARRKMHVLAAAIIIGVEDVAYLTSLLYIQLLLPRLRRPC